MLLSHCIAVPRFRGNRLLAKTLPAMRITAFLLLVTCLQVQARGFGQQITLTFANTPLPEAFDAISRQSGYKFFFNERLIRKAKTVTAKLENVSLSDALDLCFKGQPFGYAIVEKTVVIKPLASPPASSSLPETPIAVDPVPISGVVTGPDNQPLEGVSVSVKGSARGAYTNQYGKFSILAGEKDKTLVFSFVGMKTLEVPINGKTVINVTLEASTTPQDEIVVVGYGTSRVRDMTGSVARLTAKDFEGTPPHADMAAMLQGKAAGVNVMIANGAPGATVAVQIRGISSLTGNNQPLWVIDGIPQYSADGSDIADVLYNFNVNDVESIDILKDASATAIYGSRAANGVILVTTKKGGRNMRPKIDFSYNVGVQVQRDQFRMLTTDEFKDVLVDAARNYFSTSGTAPASGGISLILDNTKVVSGAEVDYFSAPIRENLFYNGITNWWDEMTQNSVESKYDVSVRGGNQGASYYISFGLIDQEGIVKGSDRRGYIGRLNFDTRIGEGLKAGIALNGSYSATNNKDNMVDKIWNFRPDLPMYDENGKIFDPGYNEENPLTSLKNRNLAERKGLNATGFLEYTPVKSLLLRSSFSVNNNTTLTDVFTREGTAYTTHQGQASMTQNESSNWVFENTATYTKLFSGVHSFNGVAGFVMEKGVYRTFSTSVQNFPDQDIMTNLTSGTTPMAPRSSYTSNALVSALTRLNYKYADKYLATFTFRADGSSRFGPGRRWGYFPSGALAWIASNEPFLKRNAPALSLLKLRLSTGRSGSQVLGNHDWRTLYAAAQYYEQPGMAPSQLGNNELQWEQTTSVDAGIDYGLFEDRLRGSIGAYIKKTSDIIYTKNIPTSSAYTSVKQNVASIQNKGVEFDITYDFIRRKDLTVSLNFNIARNTAKALEINGVDSVIKIYSGSALAMQIKEGEPLNQWFGFKWSGRYYQSMEEYNLLSSQNPTTGAKIWYQSGLSTIRPGDLRLEDTNGDGIVNNDDMVPLGSAQPKFFGGFSPSMRYKNLSVQTTFSFSYGAQRYWYTNSANWYGLGLFLKNYPAYVLDSWRADNRDAAWPRMAFGSGSSNTFNDFWLSRADYLRLNLVRVSYRVPPSLLHVKLISSIDLSLSATNLFTLTNYNGIDPQGNFRLSAGGIAGTGSDYGTYPSVKTFNLSAKVSLK